MVRWFQGGMALPVLFVLACFAVSKAGQKGQVELRKTGAETVEVLIQGTPFTTWRAGGVLNHVILTRPVLWPVLTPRGTPLTRDWPLRTARTDEPTDHAHHGGVWLAYGDLRVGEDSLRVDTWAVYRTEPGAPQSRDHYRAGPRGMVRCLRTEVAQDEDAIDAECEWFLEDTGKAFLRERRRMVFDYDLSERHIDFTIRLQALDQGVLFEDSKEGFFAVRVAPALQESGSDTSTLVDFPPGHARYLNAYGAEGEPEVWGKRSPWVALRGTLETGEPVTIVFMDHPDNVNHPPTWMARGYGLFAVNPFGLRAYTAGQQHFDFHLPAGGTVTFKYRLLFYFGRLSSVDEIAPLFEAYAAGR